MVLNRLKPVLVAMRENSVFVAENLLYPTALQWFLYKLNFPWKYIGIISFRVPFRFVKAVISKT